LVVSDGVGSRGRPDGAAGVFRHERHNSRGQLPRGWRDTAGGPLEGLLATLIHGADYLVVTALAAGVVYERFGLGLLHKAWFNLDLL
jgi:hypothetical protein